MKTHRIWSNLVDFTKVEFEKQGGEVGGVGDEFATDLEKRIGSPTRSSPDPPPRTQAVFRSGLNQTGAILGCVA